MVTSAGEVHQRAVNLCKNLLVKVYDAPLEENHKLLDLRGVLTPSCLQIPDKDCNNPELRRYLANAPTDLRILSLGELGIEWHKEGGELLTIGEKFSKLELLDLSGSHLGGKMTEQFLNWILNEIRSLKVCMYDTPFLRTKWKDQIHLEFQERILVQEVNIYSFH